MSTRLLCGLTPKGGEENIALGLAYERQGRSEEAIREFQAALRIRPNDAVAHCDLGMVYAQLGRMDEAISEFQAALRIYPNYADAHCGLGVVYGQLGRLAEARQEAQLALQLRSGASARVDSDAKMIVEFCEEDGALRWAARADTGERIEDKIPLAPSVTTAIMDCRPRIRWDKSTRHQSRSCGQPRMEIRSMVRRQVT